MQMAVLSSRRLLHQAASTQCDLGPYRALRPGRCQGPGRCVSAGQHCSRDLRAGGNRQEGVGRGETPQWLPILTCSAVSSVLQIFSSFTTLATEKEMLQWQGQLVNDMRYLASVVTQCFTAFGELLALNKRFAELTGGVTRCALQSEPPDVQIFRS